MSTKVRFLYASPQQEVASLLEKIFTQCKSASVVAGFITPDGIKALKIVSSHLAVKLSRLVIGAGTYQAFQAVDQLIGYGAPAANIRIHLGHSQRSSGKKNPFKRYHPMLHSKVYLFEMPDGSAAAFIGSHNMTGFALRGLNGEAGTLIEGPRTEAVFDEIRSHIDEAFRQAVAYQSSMKEAYAWWTREFLDGLKAEANDSPRDAAETKGTFVIVAVAPKGILPASGDVIYFEVAERVAEISSLGQEVHVHIFSSLPSSPTEALMRLDSAEASLACKTEGLEVGSGGVELAADWSIDDRQFPQLNQVAPPFRPATSPGMRQIRVRVIGPESKRYEYLFDSGKQAWFPEFDVEDTREDPSLGRWHRVKGLSEREPSARPMQEMNLLEASPESGSFILYSRRRRPRD